MPENKKKYTGAWCPSITPFDADGKLDLAALEKHFSRLSEAGTDGVLLMGSIGEFTALSMDERVSLIHAARTMTHLPLIANVSGTCMEDMTRLADAAYSEGYEAVMALPHYYFAQTPRQLEAYFDTLGGRFEGEWLIYNFPARTGCDVWLDTSSCTPFIQPDLLKAILRKHPQDRILFGSDYPLYDPGDAMMHLQEKAELGDADLDRYCSNADALFA